MASQRLWASIRQSKYNKMRSAIDTLKPLGVKPAWVRNKAKSTDTKEKTNASFLIVEAVRYSPLKNNLKVIRALKFLNCPLTPEQQWILERNK